VLDLGYEVCNEGSILGMVPFHSCEKGPQNLADLTAQILQHVADPCTGLAITGNCQPQPDSCVFPGGPPWLDCGCSSSAAANLDFSTATLEQSNLGGLGPDSGAEELRYGSIGTVQGQSLDLVVTTLGAYAVNNNGMNGRYGKFGRINTKASSPLAMSDFKFSFVEAGTSNEVVVPEVHLILAVKGGVERFASKNFAGYVTDMSTKLTADLSADGQAMFTASEQVPVPANPMAVTEAQRAMEVMYFYKNIASLELSFGAAAARNIFFAFKTVLSDRCSA
jgi:hypothetical protein